MLQCYRFYEKATLHKCSKVYLKAAEFFWQWYINKKKCLIYENDKLLRAPKSTKNRCYKVKCVHVWIRKGKLLELREAEVFLGDSYSLSAIAALKCIPQRVKRLLYIFKITGRSTLEKKIPKHIFLVFSHKKNQIKSHCIPSLIITM